MSERDVADEDDARDDAKKSLDEDAPPSERPAKGEAGASDDDDQPPPSDRPAKRKAGAKRAAAAKPEARPTTGRKRAASKKDVDAGEPVEEVVAAKPAVAAVTIAEERAARRALAAGGTLAVIGLALVGTGPSEAGMAISLAGLIALIYGIHTYGRLGPEPAK